jgi:TatD DNase family protein
VTSSGATPPPGPWVDSHCHVPFLDDGHDADSVLARARDAGVEWLVTVGTDLQTSRDAVALAARHDDVYATVGLHPHDASRLDDEWDALATLATSARVVAVGECGFDLHYRHSSDADQERAFRAQVVLARTLGTTLVIHTREAWDDTFRVLADEGLPPRVVFHCFTGGPEEARRALDAGALLSFSGIVSFRNATDVRAAAAYAPPDRVLVETDSPYLTPVPHRARPNQPALVGFVGAALADAAARPVADVAAATAANARRAFALDERDPR